MRRAIFFLGLCTLAPVARANHLIVRNNCQRPFSVAVNSYRDGDVSGVAPVVDGAQMEMRGIRVLAKGDETAFDVGGATYLNAEVPGTLSLYLGHIGSEHVNYCHLNFKDPNNKSIISYLSKKSLEPQANGRFQHGFARESLINGMPYLIPSNEYSSDADDCGASGLWTIGPFIRVPPESFGSDGIAVVGLCRDGN